MWTAIQGPEDGRLQRPPGLALQDEQQGQDPSETQELVPTPRGTYIGRRGRGGREGEGEGGRGMGREGGRGEGERGGGIMEDVDYCVYYTSFPSGLVKVRRKQNW